LTSFNLNSTNTNNLNKLLVNQQQQQDLQSKLNNKDLNSINGNLKMNSNGLVTTPNRSFSKIKLPTLDAYKRIHSEKFPQLDANKIQRLINLNCSNSINNDSSINNNSSIIFTITTTGKQQQQHIGIMKVLLASVNLKQSASVYCIYLIIILRKQKKI